MTIAEELAGFAVAAQRGGLPRSAERWGARLLVDQVGLQLVGSRCPWSRIVHDLLLGSSGSSTVLGFGTRFRAEDAAFTNASFGSALDFDDTCPKVQTHVGAVVVAIAMAIGEEIDASGLEVVRAVAIGAEVQLRAAHAVSPDCLKRRGVHTVTAAGPFGAATTAGLLLGLSVSELSNALGIAGSFSGGLIEYTQSGGSVKRIHSGIASAAGGLAARLAQAGITGPLTIFEGPKGFSKAFAEEPHPERLTDDLGSVFLLESIGLKRYPACLFIHAPIEAVQYLVVTEGLTPGDIDAVLVGTSAHGVSHVGAIPEPSDALGAQFSTHFVVALTLLEGPPTVDSFSDERLRDPQLRALARRVKVYEDDVASAEYPENWGALVTIVTVDGRRLERRVRYPVGTPQNPMTDAELRAKFLSNAQGLLGDRSSRELLGRLEQVTSLGSIRLITELAVEPGPRPPEATAAHLSPHVDPIAA